MLFNPTKETIVRTIRLPLYYTGLRQKANVYDLKGKMTRYALQSDRTIAFHFSIAPESYTWFVIQ